MDGMEHLFGLTREILKGKKEVVAGYGKNDVWCYPKVEYGKHYMFFDLGEYIKHVTEGKGRLYEEFRDFLDNRIVIHKKATDPFYYTEIPEKKFSGIATYIPLGIWDTETEAYWHFPWAGVYDAVTE